MMAEGHRLGDLQMGEAGHHRVGMGLGLIDQRRLQIRASPRSMRSIAPRTQSRKSVATWSLRERAVCRRPAAGPISSASRASMLRWMSSLASLEDKVAALDLAADLL